MLAGISPTRSAHSWFAADPALKVHLNLSPLHAHWLTLLVVVTSQILTQPLIFTYHLQCYSPTQLAQQVTLTRALLKAFCSDIVFQYHLAF